jgi:hypothetical protein
MRLTNNKVTPTMTPMSEMTANVLSIGTFPSQKVGSVSIGRDGAPLRSIAACRDGSDRCLSDRRSHCVGHEVIGILAIIADPKSCMARGQPHHQCKHSQYFVHDLLPSDVWLMPEA